MKRQKISEKSPESLQSGPIAIVNDFLGDFVVKRLTHTKNTDRNFFSSFRFFSHHPYEMRSEFQRKNMK